MTGRDGGRHRRARNRRYRPLCRRSRVNNISNERKYQIKKVCLLYRRRDMPVGGIGAGEPPPRWKRSCQSESPRQRREQRKGKGKVTWRAGRRWCYLGGVAVQRYYTRRGGAR